jgi:hypothetical protein
MTTPPEEWVKAQKGELAFHVAERPGQRPLTVRRAEEARMQRWYAGMLSIEVGTQRRPRPPHGPSVTDFGGGPASLLLQSVGWGRAIVVDPLTFTEADEERYRSSGILRSCARAEEYGGIATDESWCYNCLQHVVDWRVALHRIAETARQRIRLFEWVNVPTDKLHLHTLAADEIVGKLAALGFRDDWRVAGHARKLGAGGRGGWSQDFYAGVFTRFEATKK